MKNAMPDKVKTKAAWDNKSNSPKRGNMMSEEKAVMPRLDSFGMRKRKNKAMLTRWLYLIWRRAA